MTSKKIDDRSWIDALESQTQAIQTQLIDLRRHLHRNPELSMQEFQTTQYVSRLISDHGIAVSTPSKGVGLSCEVDFISNGCDCPRVGIRADIDALPIETMSTREYASKNKGVMHACGHDAHTAMAYGATVLIKQLATKGLLPWSVRLRTIFQPAEETAQGGLFVIEQSMINGLKSIFALHVDPSLTVGEVATRPGPNTAGCTSFEVNIVGTTGHSARPYLAIDALAAGVQFVNQVYATIPRTHDCRESSVVSFGTFHAGTAPNIVTDSATLSGTLRSLNDQIRQTLLDKMSAIAQSISALYGAKIDLAIRNDTPSLQNDPQLALQMLSLCKQLPRVERAEELQLPSMGAEDFAFIANKVPACMMRLGTGGRESDTRFPLHSNKFDIEERALCIGAQVLAAAVINACRPN